MHQRLDERSGHRGLLCPPEVGAVGPDAVQDDGQLARNRDFGLLGTDTLQQPNPSGFQRRPALDLGQQHASRLIETSPHEPVTAFGDAAGPVDFAGLVALRRQAKIGTDVARMIEPLRVIDDGHISQRHDRPDAGYRHQPPCGIVGLDQPANGSIENCDLLQQAVADRHHGGDNTIDARVSLGQLLSPLPDLSVTALADDQAKGLQDAAQLVVDLDTHLDQLVAGDQQRFSLMRRHALDLHRFEPTNPNHLGQSAGVAAIGFVGPYRQDRLGMARIETDDGKAFCQQRMGDPSLLWPALETISHDAARVLTDQASNGLGLRCDFALENTHSLLVQDAYTCFLERYVQSDKSLHGCSSWQMTKTGSTSLGKAAGISPCGWGKGGE